MNKVIKRSLLVMLFLIATSIFSSCSVENLETANLVINNKTKTGTVLYIPDTGNLLALMNDYIIYSTYNSNNSNVIYHKYNIKSKYDKIIGSIKSGDVSTNEFIIAQNSKLYLHSGTDTINLVDTKNNSIRSTINHKTYPPFVFFNKIDDDNFLISGPNILEDGTIYEYYINLVSIKTGQVKEIIKTKYNNISKSGTSMPTIFYANDKIYTYQIIGNKDDISYNICIYDLTGNLIRKIDLPEVEKFLKSEKIIGTDSIIEIAVIKNYYYFRTINNRTLLMEYKGNNFEVLFDKPLTSPIYYIESHDVASQDYGIFYDKNSLYVLDTNKSIFSKLNIKLNEYNIKYCLIDNNLNLVISFMNNKNETKILYIKLGNEIKAIAK